MIASVDIHFNETVYPALILFENSLWNYFPLALQRKQF